MAAGDPVHKGEVRRRRAQPGEGPSDAARSHQIRSRPIHIGAQQAKNYGPAIRADPQRVVLRPNVVDYEIRHCHLSAARIHIARLRQCSLWATSMFLRAQRQ